MRIMIVGHGGYATGIKSCIKSLLDLDEEIIAINYDENKSIKALKIEIKEEVDVNEEMIIFVDIVGSATFKAATEAIFQSEGNHFVVGEITVTCMLEILMNTVILGETKDIKEKINKAIEKTNKQAVVLDKGVISYE